MMFSTPQKSTITTSSKSSSKRYGGSSDRFFPSRVNTELFQITDPSRPKVNQFSVKEDSLLNKNLVELERKCCFDSLLQEQIVRISNSSNSKKKQKYKLFSYGEESTKRYVDFTQMENELPSEKKYDYRKDIREIPAVPYKILDAPGLQDDYYLNVLDWTSQNKVIVSLGHNMYRWCPLQGKASKLLTTPISESLTCLKSDPSGNKLALGYGSGEVKIFDIEKQKIESTMQGQTWRVGCISWNEGMIATGSRDKSICIRDHRAKESVQARFTGHKQEVCGIEWSPTGHLLASGGNDNQFCVWDSRTGYQVIKSSAHSAAVKAISWNPHKHNSVLSGGGTNDQTVKVWNTATCKLEKSFDTGSQVCAMKYSPLLNEFVTSHGYSNNQVLVWKMGQENEMKKIAVLQGHTSRVLYMSLSPFGDSIVTGAGDESLRFWNIFPKTDNSTSVRKNLFDDIEKDSSLGRCSTGLR